MNTPFQASRSELEEQGRKIVESLGGRWATTNGMCRCPAHDDRAPSLSVRLGDTSLLFHCFAGCESVDVLRAIRRQVTSGTAILSTDQPKATANGDLRPIAEKLWAESGRLTGTLAADYLQSRGLTSYSAQLRFHRRVQLGAKAMATYHPALIAAVRDDVGLVAVHRTFLDPATAGKAKIDSPKMLLGNPGRGAVRIGEATRVLGLAEGIETALAAAAIHKISVWAVLGNERFGMVSIPDRVEHVVILADNDAGGARAVKLAQEGLVRPGRSIETRWPPSPHNDWADAWLAETASSATP